MRAPLVACGLAAVLLTACQPAPPSEPDVDTPAGDAATGAALPADEVVPPTPAAALGPVRVGPDSVWNGDIEACRGADDAPVQACLQDTMRTSGASGAAVATAERIGGGGDIGYVSDWEERERVGIATVTYPFRANTNTGTWLVDRDGEPVDVDAGTLPDSALSTPSIQRFTEAHPDAGPFPPAELLATEPQGDGGIRFVYATPMRDCHACETLGQLRMAYDFDSSRHFSGQQVLGIEQVSAAE
ncbi:hypothetical protein [Luteimonas abyssi]|uniref:hypothetical protein n=1 Tax=Luteimonas abyssi TaxID=1247514 RepID=UPI000737B6B5|nr:hypothetical protein [Luteimonas abyssi]